MSKLDYSFAKIVGFCKTFHNAVVFRPALGGLVYSMSTNGFNDGTLAFVDIVLPRGLSAINRSPLHFGGMARSVRVFCCGRI